MDANREEANTLRRQPLLLPAILVPVYLAANVASIILPFIPGLEVFILWGAIFPLIGIIVTWTWLAKRRSFLPTWIGFGIGFTIILVAAGAMTIRVVAAIWASI